MNKSFNPKNIYVLHPNVRLRNDRVHVIAVATEGDAQHVIVLNAVDGALLSTFDGSRNWTEIVDLCTAFFPSADDPVRGATDYLNTFLGRFTEKRGDAPVPLLVDKAQLAPDELSKVRIYNPRKFAIPLDKWKPENENDFRLAFPVSMLWLLTNDCQVNCQYCYMDKPKMSRDELLPWDRVREILRQAHEGGMISIRISGGDVLCYPRIYDFLELMGTFDFTPVSIATKTYVSKEMASRLAELTILQDIQFSIDSTVPEIGDFLVQSPGFVERTLESIDNCMAAGLDVTVKTVIMPYNLPTIPRLYRDLRERGIPEIRLATYCRSGYHHKDKLFNYPDDYEWLDGEIAKLAEELPDDRIFYQNGPPELRPLSVDERRNAWTRRTRCTAGRQMITICAGGRVIPCEQMPEREGDYIGDTRTQSLQEVWQGSPLEEYLIHPPRERFKGTVCYDCPEEEFFECQTVYGGCVRENVIRYGTRWAPSPFCPRAPESIRMK